MTNTPDFSKIFLEPISVRLISEDCRNVFFIANNPLINEEVIAELGITPQDIVVQFNRAPFFDIISKFSCYKAHVFNANGDGSYWGFTKQGEPERNYINQNARFSFFYFTKWLSQRAMAFINALEGDTIGGLISRDYEPTHFAYPEGRQPSVGFQAVSHFKTLNTVRILQKRKPLGLVTLGFSGKYPPGQVWVHHDFEFEQLVYDTWLEITRLNEMGSKDIK